MGKETEEFDNSEDVTDDAESSEDITIEGNDNESEEEDTSEKVETIEEQITKVDEKQIEEDIKDQKSSLNLSLPARQFVADKRISTIKDSVGDLAPIFTQELYADAVNIVKSQMFPTVTNPQRAIIIMQKGFELGFTRMASFEHIAIISGKPALDGVAYMTKAKDGRVEHETIRDCEIEYYMDPDNPTRQLYYYSEVRKVGGKDAKAWIPDPDRKNPKSAPRVYDKVTEIKFYRASSLIKGKLLTERGIFSYRRAAEAGLLKKDSWKQYFEQMCWWRAYSVGFRHIAGDLVMGMPTVEELDDTGVYYLDEDGNVKTVRK